MTTINAPRLYDQLLQHYDGDIDGAVNDPSIIGQLLQRMEEALQVLEELDEMIAFGLGGKCSEDAIELIHQAMDLTDIVQDYHAPSRK